MASLSNRSEIMSYHNVEDLPQELKEQLPENAQHIFLAAFNAASSDGMSEEGAQEVAWSSVRNQFQQGSDGKWHMKQEDTAIHNKSVTSGGN